MRVLTVVNQKGGAGKTTTAINLGAALSRCGLKCLLVDLDPQGNLSQSAGFDDLYETDLTTYEVLTGADINKAIKTKRSKNPYDILPTDIRLSGAEIELVNAEKRNYLLKIALAKLKKTYDFIIIDSPPSLNILTLMALTAANEVIIPVQAQYLALRGVAQLRDTIEVVQKNFNPGLKIGGVLLTFFDDRRNLDKEVLEALESSFKGKVFETKISTSIKLAEAPSHGSDIISYSINSKGSVQYRELADEIIGKKRPQKEKNFSPDLPAHCSKT